MSTTPGVMSKAFWSEAGGENWARLQALMDRLNQGVADAVVERAFPGVGGSVLDVGCGGGDTTLAMARRLGPTGSCLGVDVSPRLVEMARTAARDEPAAAFQLGDAQTQAFEPGSFDVVMSRFGVMFFDDPVAAFANLRRAAKADGALVFACWRAPADNPYAQIPMQVGAPLLSEPPPPPPPADGPGRFSFADPQRVRSILADSGWREVEIAPLDAQSPLTLDELLATSVYMGPLSFALQKEDEAARERIRAAVRLRLSEDVVDGIVPMTAACWLVTAKA